MRFSINCLPGNRNLEKLRFIETTSRFLPLAVLRKKYSQKIFLPTEKNAGFTKLLRGEHLDCIVYLFFIILDNHVSTKSVSLLKST